MIELNIKESSENKFLSIYGPKCSFCFLNHDYTEKDEEDEIKTL